MCECREILQKKEVSQISVTQLWHLHFFWFHPFPCGMSQQSPECRWLCLGWHWWGCTQEKWTAIVSSTFFSDPDACWLWNGAVALLFYTYTGQALMCIQSKLFSLVMPAAMQSKRKGKQALKWALKPSLQCSENKSLFAAKKKKKSICSSIEALSSLYSQLTLTLLLVMFLHKLTPVQMWQHMLSGAITWLAWESIPLLHSNSPWPPTFQHGGGGYGMRVARPSCSAGAWGQVLIGSGAWAGAGCRFHFVQVGFGHSTAKGCLGSFGQAFPSLILCFYPLILQASQV